MREQLEETYRTEGPRLLGWMGARIGHEEARDALHEVIARTMTNLDSFEGVRDLGSWLWRAARNAVIDAWRTRARRSRHEQPVDDELLDLVADTAGGQEDALVRKELLEALSKAIAMLPPDQKAVIVDQALNGESFASIAERTGIPVDTLAARKRYALAKLRAALACFMEDTE